MENYYSLQTFSEAFVIASNATNRGSNTLNHKLCLPFELILHL